MGKYLEIFIFGIYISVSIGIAIASYYVSNFTFLLVYWGVVLSTYVVFENARKTRQHDKDLSETTVFEEKVNRDREQFLNLSKEVFSGELHDKYVRGMEVIYQFYYFNPNWKEVFAYLHISPINQK